MGQPIEIADHLKPFMREMGFDPDKVYRADEIFEQLAVGFERAGRNPKFKPQPLTLPYGEGHEPPPARKHKLTKQGVRDLGGNYSKPRRDAELPVCHHIHCRPVYLKRFQGEMGITFDLYRCIYCHKKMTEMAAI